MNYIKHLSGFFDKVSKDDRLNPTHISLYVSLFQFWNACRFHNPISISRNEAMKVSKICSKATYHKCIRELNDFGYLSYHPSYNPFKGSLVYLFDFRTGSEQAPNGEHTKIRTGNELALVPYINKTNNNKQKTKANERAHQKKNNVKVSGSRKKKKVASKKKNDFVPPEITEVREYFVLQKYTGIEAEKFFNHFTSNGWLVSGKTPMRNWQAAANKWMLNSNSFNKSSKSNLHATTEKNYNEAL